MTSGEVQDGDAGLIPLQVRAWAARAGCGRYVRGRVGAAEPRSRPHLCLRLLQVTEVPPPPAWRSWETLHRSRRRGHVWARQQTRRRRRGLGAPGEVKPRREDHNHTYRTHSSWGHLFYGSFQPFQLTRLPTLFPAQIALNSHIPKFSRIHFTGHS